MRFLNLRMSPEIRSCSYDINGEIKLIRTFLLIAVIMVERVDFKDGTATLVASSHLKEMYEDGYVFEFLLNGHPKMKAERSSLETTRDEFSMLCGVFRRNELPMDDGKIEKVAELNDRLGGFRRIDNLFVSRVPTDPTGDRKGEYEWDFVRLGYAPDHELELRFRANGFQFASLVERKVEHGHQGLFLRRKLESNHD